MSAGWRLSVLDQDALSLRRLGRVFALVFFGTFLAGYLAMLVFSASGCFLSHVIRCFSISRDLIVFSWFAAKGLSLPSVVAAVLVTIIQQIRGSVVWWNVLVASLLSALASAGRIPLDPTDALFLLVVGVIFFVGAQVALFSKQSVR